MVHLVRKMRSHPDLGAFKVVAVTDRTSLERQLQETAALTGERVRPDKDDKRYNESASDCVKRVLADNPVLTLYSAWCKRMWTGRVRWRSSNTRYLCHLPF